MENDQTMEEYFFTEAIEDLFAIKSACSSTRIINFSYENKPDENSIYVWALFNQQLKRILFSKSDLKNFRKIYKTIKIYFGPLSVNLICNKDDNKDNIVLKINNPPNLKEIITKKLNINQYPLNKFVINEFKVFHKNFDEIYKLESRNPINNKVNANNKKKTDIISEILVLDKIKSINNQPSIVNFTKDSKDNFNFNDNSVKQLNNPFIDMNKIKLNNNNNLMCKNKNCNEVNINNMNNPNIKQFQEQNNFINNMKNVQSNLNQNNFQNNPFNLMKEDNNINLNNLNNNNQFKNNGFMINYEENIEKTANQFFKLIFFPGFEKDYFPKKGLNNAGLTFYMNSTLQFLLHVPELNHYFNNCFNEFKVVYKNMIQKTETKGKISEEYYKLLKEVFNYSRFSGNAFAPKDFNYLISKLNPQFSKYESSDPKDLIIYLFQEMHEELNYFGEKKLGKIPKCNQLIESEAFNFFYEINSKLNFSIISYLFWGIIKHTTICNGCKNCIYNYQYYQNICFPLYKYTNRAFNIYKGLRDFISEEALTPENQFYCKYCRCIREAKIFSKIYYPPPYILINFDYGKTKKYIPSKIDFGAFIFLDQIFLDNKTPSVDYELISIGTHLGDSGNSGHYITYCKDISSENIWYRFNDSKVSQCSFEETKNNYPYILLYKKSNK